MRIPKHLLKKLLETQSRNLWVYKEKFLNSFVAYALYYAVSNNIDLFWNELWKNPDVLVLDLYNDNDFLVNTFVKLVNELDATSLNQILKGWKNLSFEK